MTKSLFEDIENLESFRALENILPGCTLKPFQCADLVKMLYFRKVILAYETGLGKTLMGSAFMKLVRNKYPGSRFIWFVKKSQLVQTPAKIKEYTGMSVLDCTGEASKIDAKLTSDNLLNCDCLILTHACLDNPRVKYKLLLLRNLFTGIIIDEAHGVSNLQGSNSAMALYHLASYYPYRIALTATPITTAVAQLANLIKIINEDAIISTQHTTAILENEGVKYFKHVVLVRRRKDLGLGGYYKSHVDLVKPLPHQEFAEGIDMFVKTKGYGALPQFNKLLDVIKSYKGKQGLVYIHRQDVAAFLAEEMAHTNIPHAFLTGGSTLKERDEICKQFNNGKIQVVFTSITEALDLDCTFVYFYEFTTLLEQMIGRGYRGLDPRTLHIHFLFTENTGEFDYFLKNIYARSLMVSDILGTDITHIIKAAALASSLATIENKKERQYGKNNRTS